MKTYDKQKLNEYAKELFALCLDRGIFFDYHHQSEAIYIYRYIDSFFKEEEFSYKCYISKTLFRNNNLDTITVWELINIVKTL